MIPSEAVLLSVYLNASHRWRGRPTYRAAVESARAGNAAGASVFLVDLSFGAHHRIHDAKSEYAFVDVPVVVEVVDDPQRADSLAAELSEMVADGLITMEPVRVVRYAHCRHAAPRGRCQDRGFTVVTVAMREGAVHR